MMNSMINGAEQNGSKDQKMKTQRSFIKCQQNVLNIFSLFQRLMSAICFIPLKFCFSAHLGFVSQTLIYIVY